MLRHLAVEGFLEAAECKVVALEDAANGFSRSPLAVLQKVEDLSLYNIDEGLHRCNLEL